MKTRSLPANGLVVGVDASRNRSGGARAHLIGLLANSDPVAHGIREVHLWAYRALLDAVPERPWLIKHDPPALERALGWQLGWQALNLVEDVARAGCHILFTTDASTLCRFRPMVVLSQDMLSYEPGVMRYFGYGKARLRLLVILLLQNRAFRHADGVIFLSHHAARVIQQSCGSLPRTTRIPHGVGEEFKGIPPDRSWPTSGERPIQCVYVSNTAPYKHQWVVVRAIAELRQRGYDLQLLLIGGGRGPAQQRLEAQIAAADPHRKFVRQIGFVPPEQLPGYLAAADLFIFASSCENMPVTLIEAMAAGLPIACSDRGPMPEVLENGGVFFNPEDYLSISAALEQLLNDATLRATLARRAKALSNLYTWDRCADETWSFIAQTCRYREI